jgi:hypothetical protein
MNYTKNHGPEQNVYHIHIYPVRSCKKAIRIFVYSLEKNTSGFTKKQIITSNGVYFLSPEPLDLGLNAV